MEFRAGPELSDSLSRMCFVSLKQLTRSKGELFEGCLWFRSTKRVKRGRHEDVSLGSNFFVSA